MDERLKQAEKVANKLREISELEELETIIKDGMIEWSFNKEVYRVRRPTPKEKREVDRLRNDKYIELIQNDKNLFREQLITIYKKKGIDINRMDDEILENQKKQEDLQERLGPVTDKRTIEQLEREIHTLRVEQAFTNEKKRELLKYCIEQQLIDYMNNYFSYMLFEKKVGVKWERAFSSYEEFLNAEGETNEQLITRAVYYLSLLVFKDAIQQ